MPNPADTSPRPPAVPDLLAAATTPPGAAATAPRRWLTRRVLRRASFARDLLGATKDAGIIAIVVALLMFHDEVAGFLGDLELQRGGSDRIVDVSQTLARLNRALDAAQPMAVVGASGAAAVQAPLGGKVLRAERRLLRSEDAAFIDDWIVVVAALPDAAQADAVVAQLAALSVPAGVVQKAGRWRVVATAGTADAAQSVLNRVRARFPRALPTTVSSWCPPAMAGAAATDSCRRP